MYQESDDLYKILEASPDSSQEELKKAWKAIMKKCHPDHNRGEYEYWELRCQEINRAYSILKDPQQRSEFDKRRKAFYAKKEKEYAEQQKLNRKAEEKRERIAREIRERQDIRSRAWHESSTPAPEDSQSNEQSRKQQISLIKFVCVLSVIFAIGIVCVLNFFNPSQLLFPTNTQNPVPAGTTPPQEEIKETVPAPLEEISKPTLPAENLATDGNEEEFAEDNSSSQETGTTQEASQENNVPENTSEEPFAPKEEKLPESPKESEIEATESSSQSSSSPEKNKVSEKTNNPPSPPATRPSRPKNALYYFGAFEDGKNSSSNLKVTNGLKGTAFDLGRNRYGKEFKREDEVGPEAALNTLRSFVKSWSQGKLQKFQKSPKTLSIPYLFIPHPGNVNNRDVAKELGFQNHEPLLCIWYRGVFIPNKTGRIRLLTTADDALCVEISGKPLADNGYNLLTEKCALNSGFSFSKKLLGIPAHQNKKTIGSYSGLTFRYGPWIQVVAGKRYPIEILIADFGRHFYGALLFEVEGAIRNEAEGKPKLMRFSNTPVDESLLNGRWGNDIELNGAGWIFQVQKF